MEECSCEKSENYEVTFDIERIFGTSLFMYLSAMRSNNLKLLDVAKNCFASLFHVNNNSNYSIIDIYEQYQNLQMKKYAPHLYEYLKPRRFINKSGKAFGYQPLDAIHEGKLSNTKILCLLLNSTPTQNTFYIDCNDI